MHTRKSLHNRDVGKSAGRCGMWVRWCGCKRPVEQDVLLHMSQLHMATEQHMRVACRHRQHLPIVSMSHSHIPSQTPSASADGNHICSHTPHVTVVMHSNVAGGLSPAAVLHNNRTVQAQFCIALCIDIAHRSVQQPACAGRLQAHAWAKEPITAAVHQHHCLQQRCFGPGQPPPPA
jgi:hypothetical protein